MEKTRSRDGTDIAFERTGSGALLVLVVGAFNDRSTGAQLVAFLAERFTVLTYDRRGRGDSGDAATYAPERELEDLEAVIAAAGGSAGVIGYSSGAALALAAAARGPTITTLALYDLPPPQDAHHVGALAMLVESGRRGDAVEHFQREIVRIPEDVVRNLRGAPFRPALERMAHTLVYDATIMAGARLAPEVAARIRQPTLAIAGGAGAPIMRDVAEAVARSLPNARAHVLPDATHDLSASLLGPVLAEHFAAPTPRGGAAT